MEIHISEENLLKSIDGSPMNFGQVFEILKENAFEFREILNECNLIKISARLATEIQGFNSKIYFFDFIFDDEKIPLFQVVMKCSYEAHELPPYTSIGYDCQLLECEFYRLFNESLPVPIPKIYFIQKPNPENSTPCVILMENLSTRGIVLDHDAYVREEQVIAVIENVAKLHAFMLSQNDLWSRRCTLNDSPAAMTIDELRTWIENGARLRPGFLDAELERLTKFIDGDAKNYARNGICKDLGIPTFVIHGDLWNNNIIWRKNSDGNDSNEVLAFIDWQVCGEKNPTFDIARYLVLCVEGNLRRKIEEYILEYYFEKLQLHCNDKEKLEGFSVEKLKKMYAYALARQAVSNVSYMEMRKDPGPNSSVEDQQAYTDLIDRMMKNAKWALEDAVIWMEKYDPKWLN